MLIRNSTLQGAAFAAAMASTFGIYVAIARGLGPETLGQMAFWMTVARLYLVLTDFGTSTLLRRDLAGVRDRGEATALYGSAIYLRLLTAFVGLLGVWVACALLAPLGTQPLLALLIFAWSACRLTLDVKNAVFVSHGDFLRQAGFVAANDVGAFAAFASVIAAGGRLESALLASVALSATVSVVAARSIRRNFGFAWRPLRTTPSAAWRLARQSLSLGLGTALGNFAFKSDTLFLGLLDAPRALGMYNAAGNFVNAGRAVGASVAQAALPALSEIGRADAPLAWRRFVRLSGINAALGSALAIVLAAGAPLLITFVFGNEFLPGAECLRILAFSAPFAFANLLCWSGFAALHRESSAARILAVGAAANLALNAILIPRLSIVGAAWATLCSEALMTLLYSGAIVLIARTLPGDRARGATRG